VLPRTNARQPLGVVTRASVTERLRSIEPELSAWEAVSSGPVTWPDLRRGVPAIDRERSLVTGVNGPLMARRAAVRPALMTAPGPPPPPR
jgi:hypothetical protein